jgi:thioredoxin reductase
VSATAIFSEDDRSAAFPELTDEQLAVLSRFGEEREYAVGDIVFRQDLGARVLFVFIGADPHTDWLDGAVELDESGFILTGRDLGTTNGAPPLPLETSLTGVFAAGDVRSGSIKRVASAVGEGSMAVRLVHDHFARSTL